MLHNAKRGLSILLAVLMCVGMLTAIVLPASATTPEPAADPYAKITGEADGDVIVPDENVYFVDGTWAENPNDLAYGDEFEYTYGDGEIWGNGKTYRLTWDVNTFTDFKDAQAAAQVYSSDWASDPEYYKDEVVLVFAPGKQTTATSPDSGKGDYSNMTPATEENVTTDDLITLTLLGPQAGKTPVADNYLTSKEAAKVINNDRSVDSATEFVFSSTTYVFTHANSVWDGFAFTGGAKLFAANFPYQNFELRNSLAYGIKNCSGSQFFAIGSNGRQSIIKFYDNYFDFAQGDGSSSQDMYGNLIDFDGNVFTGGKVAKTDQYQQAWHIKLYPTKASAASASFYGEDLAKNPQINVTNNAFADWESRHCLRFPFENAGYTEYNANEATINIIGNSFMDCGTYGDGDVIMINTVSTQDMADSFTLNIQDNYVNFSDEVFSNKNFIFAQGNGSSNVEGSTNIEKYYKWNIWGNKIVAPNNGHDNLFNSCGTQIDLSGNLFTDNQGNVLPMRASWVASLNGNWTVQSDLYASGAMKGGIREMFTVRELGAENASVLYNYFQLRSSRAKQSGKDYILASLSLLLKDGVEFDPDTLLVYDDDAIVYEGMYLDEACTQKMDKITQADLYPAAGKTIWAKATLTEEGTTLTVKYRVTTPEEYLIVDPEGDYGETGYTFNGATYMPGETNATTGIMAHKAKLRGDGKENGFYQYIDNSHSDVSATNADYCAYGNATNPSVADNADDIYKNRLTDLIVLTPGTYDFKTQGMGKSVAYVGPQWGVSPFDADLAKEKKMANGRSYDPATEAVVLGALNPAHDNSLHFVFDGIVFAGTTGLNCSAASNLLGSNQQHYLIDNCVFNNRQAINGGGYGNNGSNRISDYTIRDCYFDGGDVDYSNDKGGVDGTDALILVRSNRFSMTNCAVVDDDNFSTLQHRTVYCSLTNGALVKYNARRLFAEFSNNVIMDSKRDGILYTLRDTTTLNANFNYYPDGAELIVKDNYFKGGYGYLYGVQNGEATGSEKFTKATVTGNYFHRDGYDGNLIAHYNTNAFKNTNAYTDDSVIEDNIFITRYKTYVNGYGATANLDDNFYGYYEDGELKASYISSNSLGFTKDPATYYLDIEKTTTNKVASLVDNGYDAFELTRWANQNEYAITKNAGANSSMFKACDGAEILEVYTITETEQPVVGGQAGETETVATKNVLAANTPFTHPQVVYLTVKSGDYTLTQMVNLTTACDHADCELIDEIITPATCKEAGVKNVLCGWCGEALEEGLVVPKANHIPGEMVVVTPATCGEAGVGKTVCTVCEEDVETNIPIDPTGEHNPADELVPTVPPTCNTKGEGNQVCADCGEILEEGLIIPATGEHDEDTENIVADTPATCGAPGVGHTVCADCGETVNTGIVIPATGAHTPGELIVDEQPGCASTGKGHKNCAVCGTLVEDNIVVPSTGEHAAKDELVVDTAPSCYATGIGHSVCKDCGTTIDEGLVIPATGAHVWATTLTQGDATHYYACTTDGCTARNEETAHTAGEIIVDTAPGCNTIGTGHKDCTACGKTVEEGLTINATGEHVAADELVVDTAATCGVAGVGHSVCGTCGITMETGLAIPATGNHAWDNGVVTTEPTANTEGVKTFTCTVCGETKTEKIPTTGVDTLTIFKDLKKKDWYVKNGAIDFVYNNGLFSGLTSTEFGPNDNMTRGMFVTVLGRLHGVSVSKNVKTVFSDVAKGKFYTGYVKWANENNIVSGLTATTFGPDENVNREQICAMMVRYCNFANITLEKKNAAITFKDAAKISKFARSAVKACQQGGIVNGETTTGGFNFRPQGNATRAEVATIMMNFAKAYK